MGLTFAIRDDDTSYFTRPEHLEACYGDVWDMCPISLSVVPFHASTKSGGVPPEYWEGDRTFPVGENQELVRFLRGKIREGRVCITMHGYSHQDQRDGPEFDTGVDLVRKVREGKQYLEELFGVPIRVFIPPHNTISRVGYRAVLENNLSICGSGSMRRRGIRLNDVPVWAKRKAWRWFRGLPYPFPVHYRTHTEIGYFSLTPIADPAALTAQMRRFHDYGGVFVLATHYWQFGARMEQDQEMSMEDAFRKLWSAVGRFSNTTLVTLNQLTRSGN